MHDMTNTDARFWAHVRKANEPGDCWLWTGARTQQGYGMFWDGAHKRSVGAHRYAWEVSHEQPIPLGRFIRHRCDNPACVRPSHLKLATPQDKTHGAFYDAAVSLRLKAQEDANRAHQAEVNRAHRKENAAADARELARRARELSRELDIPLVLLLPQN